MSIGRITLAALLACSAAQAEPQCDGLHFTFVDTARCKLEYWSARYEVLARRRAEQGDSPELARDLAEAYYRRRAFMHDVEKTDR